MLRLSSLAASCLLAAALPAAAQSNSQHVDISLYTDNGQVGTGFYDFDTSSFVLDARLYSEPLEIIQTSYHGVGAPGFYSDATNPLPGSAIIDFDVPAIDHPFKSSYANAPYTVDLHNMLYWDGVDDDQDGNRLDDVAFSTVPAGTTMLIRKSTFVNVTVDGSSSPVAGFTLGATSGGGALHEHVAFRVQGPGGSTPDDGIYVLPMTLGATGLTDSETVYIVFNGDYDRDSNGDLQFDGIVPRMDTASAAAAEQWVESYLLRPLGDFNDTDALDANDIDQLFDQRGLADPTFGFDLTGDAIVTDADIDRWVLELAGTSYGDADLNGTVGQSDLDSLLANWGQSGVGWANGDFDGDGFVGQADLAAVLVNWQAIGIAPDLSLNPAVPEPTTLAMLGLAGVLLGTRRRRMAT